MKSAKITKEQIFKAAKKIAHEQGLKQVNIRNVAKECQVSVGSVYNNYETKGDLVFDVVKDYWQSAFDRESLSALPPEDFCEFFGEFYQLVGKKLMGFMSEWVSVMSAFSDSEKMMGKRKEAEIFDEVRNILSRVMAADKKIQAKIWQEKFDREEMLDFIIFNMLNMLKQGRRDCSFFIKVLRELLY
ncbi:MAG: TetR/AcrR family transcriptional regulator [Bacillota bacterium]